MLRKKLTRKSSVWPECACWCYSYSNVHRGLFPKQILTQQSLPSPPRLFQQHYLSHKRLLLRKATIAPQWTYVTLLVDTEGGLCDTISAFSITYLEIFFLSVWFCCFLLSQSCACAFYTIMTQQLSFIKAALRTEREKQRHTRLEKRVKRKITMDLKRHTMLQR